MRCISNTGAQGGDKVILDGWLWPNTSRFRIQCNSCKQLEVNLNTDTIGH